MEYIKTTYKDQYWNALPKEVTCFWRDRQSQKKKTILPQKYEVKLIDPIADPTWDAFVENHPFGWICHLSGWKQVLEKSFPHIKGYYFVLFDDSSKEIKAGMPVFEVKSWLTGKRLVSIPFATLCDPLISNNDELKFLFEEIFGLMKEVGALHIELRSRAAFSLLQEDHFYVQRFYRHHYLILDKDPEHLKINFHRTCVRQRINRATCSNLVFKVGDCESDLKLFYHLYVLTRKRLGLPPLPYLFFKSIWEAFSPCHKIMLLLAKCDDQLAAGLILLKFRDRVSAEFAASDTTYNDFSPNHLLFWEAIKSAYSEGYKIFDFGRTSPNNKTLMEFKNHWGTQVVDLPIFYYPKETVDRLGIREELRSYKMINKVCHWAPESAMGFIGSFCYKHLG